MNPELNGIADALSRAWKAVVKAFTSTPESRGSQHYGADTTLFGGPDQTGTGSAREREADQDDFWDPTGTSTDFADPDPTGDTKRR